MTRSLTRSGIPQAEVFSRKFAIALYGRRHFNITSALFLLISMMTVAAQAQTFINPGDTVVLSAGDDLTCATEIASPSGSVLAASVTECNTYDVDSAPDVDPRHLNILTAPGISFDSDNILFAERATSTAKLINQFQITSGGSEVLPVQISTEVSWSGVLVVLGANSTFAQIIATLQVRDTTTNQVVASNTFLSERVDADPALNLLEAIDGVDVTNSSGADITALLVRGRTYAIEVEAKCDSNARLISLALCSFYDGANVTIPGGTLPGGQVVGNIKLSDMAGISDLLGGDGFDVANITVSVGSDLVESLTNN